MLQVNIQSILAIIAAIGLVIGQVVTAWRVGSTERLAVTADKKLDTIHTLTNSNLTAVKKALIRSEARIANLERLLKEARTPK